MLDTWKITGVDPDALTDPEPSAERGVIATRHGERGEALARGCEAIADGWIDVQVEGTFTVYPLVDPAVSA
jgi:hypothetical protein